MLVVNNVYTFIFAAKLKRLQTILYSLRVQARFGYMGRSTYVAYPCKFQGCGSKYITVGNNTNIESHCIFGCWVKYGKQTFSPSIVIGNNCSIGEYTHITACNKITIGDGLLTGRFVYIGDNSHGRLTYEDAAIPPSQRKLISKGEIVIGENVWIGDKATILGGVSVGDNAIIGANSVVTKNVPPNCVVAGVPAKIIKSL